MKTRTRVLILAVILVMALLLCACGQEWTCDDCGKSWKGTAYYGWDYDDTYCEDCAREYWMPLPYENYEK